MITVFGYTFNDKPYLTTSEDVVFRRMMNTGVATIFRVSFCQADGCSNYVPKGIKKYCSKTCFMKEEGGDEENEENEK